MIDDTIQKKVVLSNGKTVEIVDRPKRVREPTCRSSVSLSLQLSRSISAPLTISVPSKKAKISDKGKKKVVTNAPADDATMEDNGDMVEADDPSLRGNKGNESTKGTDYQMTSLSVNNTVDFTRKEKRAMERAVRESMSPTLEDDDDDTVVHRTHDQSSGVVDASKL